VDGNSDVRNDQSDRFSHRTERLLQTLCRCLFLNITRVKGNFPMVTARRRKSIAATTESKRKRPESILVVDIGGTKLKILASGETKPRKMVSGKNLTPARMVEAVRELAKGWKYDAISIGYPGRVGSHGPSSDPGNLAAGWVGFDFAAAFDCPVRIINDAAMQALGSYEGGRMLFLGLGTGLGSALIGDYVIVPLELGELEVKKGSKLGDMLGHRGLKKLGKEAWRAAVNDATGYLISAFCVDYLVLGGGNAKSVRALPANVRRGNNLTAFRGGLRLWNLDDIPTLSSDGETPARPVSAGEWRVI
jgi:polyphosphate glucokinase